MAGNRACILPCSTHLREVTVAVVSPRVYYPLFTGFVHLGASLVCGLTDLAAGYAIGFTGNPVSRCLQSIPRFPLKAYDGFLVVCESMFVDQECS